MLQEAKVTGLVKIIEVPTPNHFHDGRIYNSVTVEAARYASTTKVDYLRLYFEPDQFESALFTVGNVIEYTGILIKSKITESLSDIAVSLETAELAAPGSVPTGSVLTMRGTIVKIGEESISQNVTSISILVMHENEDNRRVIAKLTGIGKAAAVIKTLAKDMVVDITARVYSYQIKNKIELENYYLHDSRIISIVPVMPSND